jgi:predicted  nucleic acid-binding Zn-ribbon protein
MNENIKYLEVPEIKETISTIQNHLTEANNLFQPFWVKLSKTQDKLDLSENQMKILENDINKSKSEIVEMRNVSESLSEQNRNLSIKVDELIPQLESAESNLSTLHQKMAETEERVIASIKKQKELIDTVDELLIKVNDTGLSVVGANKKLSNIISQMERILPKFDYVEKTLIQAQEIKSTFEDIQKHTRGTEHRILNLHGSITRTESRFTKLSNNVKTVEHHLAAVDDKHTQLVTRQVELDDNMEKSKNDIINLDDQLTKAKVADFNGKLASTKEDMTQRLGKLSGDIAKAESEMSSIKTESEGYTNRINDLENRTNERIDKLYVRTEIEEQYTSYVKNTLPDVVSNLETIKGSGTYNIIIYYSSYYVYMEFFK